MPGHPKRSFWRDEKELRAEAQQYRASIDSAWKATGLPYLPPSWEKEGTHWGDTETLWPTMVLDRDDPRVAASIEVSLSVPQRNPPKRILIHLPASRPLLRAIPGVIVVARPNQKQRWDFSTVVEKYRSSKGLER